jgi:hypothetical protein
MKIFAKQGNVTIVGDPDQSIYSWRAAGEPIRRNIFSSEVTLISE